MTDSARMCYICMDNEGGESEWVSPCRCSGSIQWVHQECLMRWVKLQETVVPWKPLRCSTCRTLLRLLPEKGLLLTTVDFIYSKVYPVFRVVTGWSLGLVIFESVCNALGLFTQSQTYGLEETLAQPSIQDGIPLSVRLHVVSTSIIVVNVIPWEVFLLEGLRILSRLPGGKWIFPEYIPHIFPYRIPEDSHIRIRRCLVNSALLPLFAKVIGDIFYDFIDSKTKRFVIGGVTFIGVKGCLYMYMLHKKELRRKNLTILRVDPA